MKKSKFMRVAAVLMAAVLLTTCAISGTFAKYVTTGPSTSNTAQVAKWGITLDVANDSTLFSRTYANEDATGETLSLSNTVVAGGEYNVVAPGTASGSAVTYTFAGTPEVAYRVAVTADLSLTGWTTDGTTEYCPLIITVGTVAYAIGDSGDNDATHIYVANVAALETAVEGALAAGAGDYDAGTSAAGATIPAIGWSWPFSTTGNDANDTALGNRAAAGNPATITLTTAVTVTQLD